MNTMSLRKKVTREKVSGLITPLQVLEEIPLTVKAQETITRGKETLIDILTGKDPRIAVFLGGCSFVSEEETVAYTEKILPLQERVADRFVLFERVYGEKPRTTVGWKGKTYDPDFDGSYKINEGIIHVRKAMRTVNEMGLPVITEILTREILPYYEDLIATGALGARNAESTPDRAVLSGLDMPIGIKNTTDGSTQNAVDAVLALKHSHTYPDKDEFGQSCIIRSSGNPYGYVILRGGKSGTNFDSNSIQKVIKELLAANLDPSIVIDCSHGNSFKDYTKQHIAWYEGIRQIVEGRREIKGLMLESNLLAGKQKDKPVFGLSRTDECIGIEETEELLLTAYDAFK